MLGENIQTTSGRPHGTGVRQLLMSVVTDSSEHTFFSSLRLPARPVKFFDNRKLWNSGRLLKKSHQKILIFH